jgi:hypothetical protein
VTEEFALKQSLGHGTTIQLDEGALGYEGKQSPTLWAGGEELADWLPRIMQ